MRILHQCKDISESRRVCIHCGFSMEAKIDFIEKPNLFTDSDSIYNEYLFFPFAHLEEHEIISCKNELAKFYEIHQS